MEQPADETGEKRKCPQVECQRLLSECRAASDRSVDGRKQQNRNKESAEARYGNHQSERSLVPGSRGTRNNRRNYREVGHSGSSRRRGVQVSVAKLFRKSRRLMQDFLAGRIGGTLRIAPIFLYHTL